MRNQQSTAFSEFRPRLSALLFCGCLGLCAAAQQNPGAEGNGSAPQPAAAQDELATTSTVLPGTLYGDLLADRRVFRYDFAPPLGIDDAIFLVRSSMLLLDPGTRRYVELDRAKIDQVLLLTADYLKLLDNRYSTLRDYKWIELSSHGVAPGGVDQDQFKPSTPIENVSALAIRVSGEDIVFEQFEVWDTSKRSIKPELGRRVFPAGKPARDVIFLNRQVYLERVLVGARSVDTSKDAKLTIEAGITSVPEHVKYAIGELERARLLLSEESDIEAIEALRQAWQHINRFRVQVNL